MTSPTEAYVRSTTLLAAWNAIVKDRECRGPRPRIAGFVVIFTAIALALRLYWLVPIAALGLLYVFYQNGKAFVSIRAREILCQHIDAIHAEFFVGRAVDDVMRRGQGDAR